MHLPLLNNAVASRFAMIEWFFLALMLAMILTDLHAYLARRSHATLSNPDAPTSVRRRRRSTRRRGAAALGVALVAVAALLPLVPSWPYGEARVDEPSLAVGSQIRSVPVGQVVLGYPFPTKNTDLMVWQAVDKMRFRIVGGSLIQAVTDGENLNSAAPASTCQTVLNSDYLGGSAPQVALTPPVFSRCASEMLAWHVGTVLWTNLGEAPARARAFFTGLLGPASVEAADSALWLNPQPALKALVSHHGTLAGRFVQHRR